LQSLPPPVHWQGTPPIAADHVSHSTTSVSPKPKRVVDLPTIRVFLFWQFLQVRLDFGRQSISRNAKLGPVQQKASTPNKKNLTLQ
jgi:hypothetical protein